MLSAREAREILRSLAALPDEKAAEVRDFVPFLGERYAGEAPVDPSDEWTDDDLQDLTRAVLDTADRAERLSLS